MDGTYFNRREFSFTLPGDIYMRYQSFKDASDMASSITSKVPVKIDIGPVFDTNPQEAKKSGVMATAIERELIFDIDMTDYDDVRSCCSGAGLCIKCWPFLAIAAKILDRTLRKDFGFKHILWIYSGRRGIHCWVGDERSRKLREDVRDSIVQYLTLVTGGLFEKKKCRLDPEEDLHPSVRHAVKIIQPKFEDLIIRSQQLFDTPQQINSIVELCTNPHIKNSICETLDANKNHMPWTKWNFIQAKCHYEVELMSKRYGYVSDRHYLEEVMLQYCYPRLDAAVSKKINHLLKAPFCIHPKTERVCIPFDVKTVDSFDPTEVPSLNEIISSSDITKVNPKFQKGIKLFEQFIQNLQKTEIKDARLEKSDLRMEF